MELFYSFQACTPTRIEVYMHLTLSLAYMPDAQDWGYTVDPQTEEKKIRRYDEKAASVLPFSQRT
jgi:hypothetical protein